MTNEQIIAALEALREEYENREEKLTISSAFSYDGWDSAEAGIYGNCHRDIEELIEKIKKEA